MSRLFEIGRIEKLLFGKKHTTGMDFTFSHLDDYLSENFFGSKTIEWMELKVDEELDEVKDAYDQLKTEYAEEKLQEISIHHFIEEVGDFILAMSSVVKVTGLQGANVQRINRVKDLIENVNYLLIAIKDGVVNPDVVFQSNKSKIEEYYSAVKTWEELQLNEITSQNILVNLIKRLYTTKEYTNPENKNKIIKELRRMRFAIVHSQMNNSL